MTGTANPAAVRGRYLKELLAYAFSFDQSQPPSAFVSPAYRVRIDEAATSDWLPIEIMFDLARRCQLALGPTRYADFNRKLFLRQLQTPLLRPILFAARSVFHVGVHGLLRHLPRGWSQTYRGMGQPRFEIVDANRSLVFLEDLPAVCFDEPPWLDGTRHAFSGMFELAGVEGNVTLSSNPPKRVVTLTFTSG